MHGVDDRAQRLDGRLRHRPPQVIAMDGVASEAFGTDITLAWRTFRTSGVERHGIILILPGGAFHWLPKSGFENEAAWEEAAEIARKRLPKSDVDLIN